MPFAETNLALEPAWPWSLPTLGWPAFAGAAFVLAALTVWTYLGVKNATWRRVAVVLLLRLSALVVAFSMMMRPSFAFTQLEGVEVTKLLVVFDASRSMNVAEVDGQPSRWEQVRKLWASPEVQRRIERLRSEQKIEVVRYVGGADLQADDSEAAATGERTDIGGWLHQLRIKHAHEKHLRGVVLFSDGADNGTRYSAQEEAGHWRRLAPIQAFGVGDPTKYRKDLALTSLTVEPKAVFINSELTINAIAQAPGLAKTEIDVVLTMEPVEPGSDKPPRPVTKKIFLPEEKDQPIRLTAKAPDAAGEYKLTLKILPHPEETNLKNNEISTYVQVNKERIKILWVDRPRVYEPTFAIRFALAPEETFDVSLREPPTNAKRDPIAFYGLGGHYDVIIIGDLSAQQFAMGDDRVFDRISEMVKKQRTGLLMLGGAETFVKGGWTQHPALMELLPVALDDKAEFTGTEVRAVPWVKAPELPFLKLDTDPKKNAELWGKKFGFLDGIAPLGRVRDGSTKLLVAKNDENATVMAFTRHAGGGYVAIFGGDSTWRSWRENSEAVAGYKKFWKQLVFWLANQEDQANQLVVQLDKRRLNANAAEVLNFTFSLRDKAGIVAGATYDAKIVGPDQKPVAVQYVRDGQVQRGTFQGAKEPGEHRLVIDAKADGISRRRETRFLVAFDDIEMIRPVAEHESLAKIAASSDGRFHVLEESALLQYLDELQGQVNREARHKTVHWPDWTRTPASAQTRDQLAGLWHSFGLVSFLLFVALVGTEWLLRRLWGWV
jgi:hypothetical protein